MTGKDLLMSMSYVESKYIEESESGTVGNVRASSLTLRRPVLIAAVIALILCLVGCGTVFYTLAESPLFDLPRVQGQDVPPEAIHLEILEATPAGAALRCRLDGFYENDEAIQSIFIHNGSVTLERMTDSGWELMEKKVDDIAYTGDDILTDGIYEWSVSWTTAYGLLEPGNYRLSTRVLEGHEPASVEFVIQEEVAQAQTLRELLDGTYYCVRLHFGQEYQNLDKLSREERKSFELDEGEFVEEYWKSGENLMNLTYRDGELYMGVMYLDGIKYKLTHEDPGSNLSPIAGWEVWPDYDLNRITSWSAPLIVSETAEYEYGEDGAIQTVTMSESRTSSAHPDVTVRYTTTVEVVPVDENAAAGKFTEQDVNFYREFSWKKDQKDLPALNVSFRNTTSSPITTSAEAIARAEAECSVEYTQVVVYRDEKAGMWKVEYQIMYGYQGCQYVYMNDDGITQMVSGAGSKVEQWQSSFPDPTV